MGALQAMLKALDLPGQPDAHLEALSLTLDDAGRQVAAGLASNGNVEIRNGRLQLERLGAAPEPPRARRAPQ